MDDKWFRHAIIAMFTGLAWFLAAEWMYRLGVDRISPDFYLDGPSPLLRLWLLQLVVYFVAVTVAAIVAVRLFVTLCRNARLADLLPGIALAGSLRILVSMDAGLTPHPLWFEAMRVALVTLLPLGFATWMLARRGAMAD